LLTAFRGTFAPGVADHGLIHGAAPASSSATMRFLLEVAFHECSLAVVGMTTAASGRVFDLPGVHGQAPRLARATRVPRTQNPAKVNR
jgi:hypothetical protein